MSMLTDFKALVSSTVSGRVYPNTAPDNPTAPYITYQRISAIGDNTLAGTGALENTRLQIDIWASTFADAQTKAAAVNAAMKSWSTKNTKQMEQDFYESDTKLHRVMLDFSVWHS